MQAVLQQPVKQVQRGTISNKKWDSLHTVEELDSTLKDIIHKEKPIIDLAWRSKPTYSVDEAFEKAYKQLDSLYQTAPGTLIDTDFKSKEMRPWSDVYEQLCQEVGQDYGLNDIREA